MKVVADLLHGLRGLHANTRSWIVDCPRCGKRDKLYLRKSDGIFCCFYCSKDEAGGTGGFRGRVEYALAELLQLPVKDLQDQIYGDGVPQGQALVLDVSDFFKEEDGDILPPELQPLPIVIRPPDFWDIDTEQARPGAEYLAGRGIDLELAKAYGLMYSPPRRRIVFPCLRQGQLLGWQLRTIDAEVRVGADGSIQTVPKALTMPGLRRDRLLMFEDRLQGSPHAVLCEGPVDALKAHACGGNVATLGKLVSQEQLAIIRRHGITRVYLALDPDAAAETAKLVRDLGDLELWQVLPDPGYKDLGEMSVAAVYDAWRRARRVDSNNILVYFRS